MAVYNAGASPVAVNFNGWLSINGVGDNYDTIATPVQTATQFSEVIENGYRIDYFGSFSNYAGDEEWDPSLMAPQNAWITGVNISLNNQLVSQLSGVDFEARRVFSQDVATQQALIYAGNDTIVGSAYADRLAGYGGNDVIDGGAGQDTVFYGGAAASYSVRAQEQGFVVSGPDGTDTLVNVERIQFGDKTIALDIDGNAGQAYRLYQAAFSRTPDEPGLGYWIGQIDAGMTLQQAANSFIISAEFQSLYGTNLTDRAFVEKVYQNVLGRDYDQAGFNYWLDELERGVITRDGLLASFSESAENKANVVGQIANGFEYLI